MQDFIRPVLQGLTAAGLCLFLVSCAPVQPVTPTPAPRGWFTQAELEQALIAAGVNPDERAAGLCSTDPAAPERLTTCVQYGPDAFHQWWIATWDVERQRVVVEWRSNVEVQLSDS